MANPLSLSDQIATFSSFTARAFYLLAVIDHASFPAPIRIAKSRLDLVSRSNTYVAFPFDARLPDERAGITRTSFSVWASGDPDAGGSQNNLVEAIRSIPTKDGAALVTLEVVRDDALDTVIASSPALRWTGVRITLPTIEGQLDGPGFFQAPAQDPRLAHTPDLFPSLFRSDGS